MKFLAALIFGISYPFWFGLVYHDWMHRDGSLYLLLFVCSGLAAYTVTRFFDFRPRLLVQLACWAIIGVVASTLTVSFVTGPRDRIALVTFLVAAMFLCNPMIPIAIGWGLARCLTKRYFSRRVTFATEQRDAPERNGVGWWFHYLVD